MANPILENYVSTFEEEITAQQQELEDTRLVQFLRAESISAFSFAKLRHFGLFV